MLSSSYSGGTLVMGLAAASAVLVTFVCEHHYRQML